MAYKVQKPCKICGKLYVPCGDCEHDNVAFHWRTVACSYECGQAYLAKVMAAREPDSAILDVVENDKAIIEVKPKKHISKPENNKESEQID